MESVSRGSSEPAPDMSRGEGFTVDQLNNVIQAINVNVSKEDTFWISLEGGLKLRTFC